MTPYEMEEQLKNIDARTTAIEHLLPTLATKDDLRLSTEALQDDLRLTTEALQHEIETGFEAAKAHADRLNEITRAEIRLLAEQMATKEDLQDLRQEMATKGDFHELRREMRLIGGHVRVIAKQVAVLGAPKRKKR